MRQSFADQSACSVDSFFLDDEDADRKAASKTRQALVDTQERVGMMLDIMPMGLLIHTEQGILFANREACRMLDARDEELVGQHLLDYVAESEIDKVLAQFNRSFLDASVMQRQETLLVSREGATTDIRLISSRMPWHGIPVIQVLLQDVSDLKRNEERLQLLSITDELTGAFNRRHVFSEAQRQMEAARREGFPLSVVLIDIDHFKRINDTQGHAAGDLALVEVTRALSGVVGNAAGPEAVLARLGGEEFLALLPGFAPEEAGDLAERLRQAAMRVRVEGPRGFFGLTVSLGVTSLRPCDEQFDALVSRADAALYEAKHAGRNRARLAA